MGVDFATLVDTFLLIILVSFMRELPYELEEAAKVEGCSNFGTFLRFFPAAIFAVSGDADDFLRRSVWNTFMPASAVHSGPDEMTLQVKLYLVLSSSPMRWISTSLNAAQDVANVLPGKR